MKRLLWLLLAVPAFAQSPVIGGSVQYVTTAPSGACVASPPVKVLFSSGALYTCNNGTWASQAGGGGTGTVTNIATTSPIGGGPITTTGTLTCTTCVVSSSPGVGLAHFAGSTQTVTSSAVNLAGADVTGNLPVTNLNSGTSATSSTFWRGDGTWAAPSGGGNYVNLCALVTITNGSCSNGLITGGTTPGSLVISAIPATYLNLEITEVGSVSGTGVQVIGITLNGDTAAHYAYQRYGAITSGSVTTAAGTVGTPTNLPFCLNGGTNNPIGSCTITIPMYAQTVTKVVHALVWFGDASGGGGGNEATGEWNQTTAINSVTFTPASGTFITGKPILTIYGTN